MKKSVFRPAVVISLALMLGLTMGCQKTVPGGITEQDAKIIGDWYVKARNEANLALLDNIYSPDVIVHDPSQPQDVIGLAALKSQYGNTHRAIPDVKFALDELYVKGDKLAWVFTMSGTITGPVGTPFGDIPPSGKTIRVSGVAVDRIAGGKIVEEWVYFNLLDLLQPMGFTLTPPQPPKSEGN